MPVLIGGSATRTTAPSNTQDSAMSQDKKAQADTETMLMSLDQISQTIEIMTKVVGQLRGHIEQTSDTTTKIKNTPQRSNTHTLH